MHKARFLSRHRYLLAYSHKYIITADDLILAPQIAFVSENNEIETIEWIEGLLKDFDVKKNETDRRIYYEVTGRQIGKN